MQKSVQMRAMHAAVGGQTGHIFNLGHGLLPDTPIEGIKAFVDGVFTLGDA